MDNTPLKVEKIPVSVYKGGPHWGQSQRFAHYITSPKILREHQQQYKKLVVSLKKQYKISQYTPNFAADLLIDEISMETIRIQRLEHYQHGLFLNDQKCDDSVESLLSRVKDHRKKAIETLKYLCEGGLKSPSHRKIGKLSYRNKLNRSKKLQQVETVEKTLGRLRDDVKETRAGSRIEPETETPEEPPEAEYPGEVELGEGIRGDV